MIDTSSRGLSSCESCDILLKCIIFIRIDMNYILMEFGVYAKHESKGVPKML